MATIPTGLGAQQLAIQLERSAKLKATLSCSFTMTHSFAPRLAPVDYTPGTSAPPLDRLVPLDSYQVVWSQDGYSGESVFKWRGYEGDRHVKQRQNGERVGNTQTACSLAMNLQMKAEDERYTQGKLHYLFGADDQDTPYGMAINFCLFGTVLPWAPCHCQRRNASLSDPPKEWIAIRNFWDPLFRRAKHDPMDVDCMFDGTPFGCQSNKCPFEHPVSGKYSVGSGDH